MALIKCPECQNSISDKAEFCPHCGLPAEYLHTPEAEGDELIMEANELGWEAVVHEGKLYWKKTIISGITTIHVYAPIPFKTTAPSKNQQEPSTRNSHH